MILNFGKPVVNKNVHDEEHFLDIQFKVKFSENDKRIKQFGLEESQSVDNLAICITYKNSIEENAVISLIEGNEIESFFVPGFPFTDGEKEKILKHIKKIVEPYLI